MLVKLATDLISLQPEPMPQSWYQFLYLCLNLSIWSMPVKPGGRLGLVSYFYVQSKHLKCKPIIVGKMCSSNSPPPTHPAPTPTPPPPPPPAPHPTPPTPCGMYHCFQILECHIAVVLTYKSIRHFTAIDTLISKQNVRRFADDTLEWIFMNENVWILIKISPKDLPKGQIKN